MTGLREWNRGDRVVHAAKPEWGHGEVLVAQPAVHDGKACQKLTIRFDRAGTKTLLSAMAVLRPAGSPVTIDASAPTRPSMHEPRETTEENPLTPDSNAAVERLTELPERASDPFLPLRTRLGATLDVYRFSDSGGSLLDWAAAQTGLKDPLSHFNRHELERHFQNFRVNADNHLRKLVREMSRTDVEGLKAALSAATPEGRQALRRAEAGR